MGKVNFLFHFPLGKWLKKNIFMCCNRLDFPKDFIEKTRQNQKHLGCLVLLFENGKDTIPPPPLPKYIATFILCQGFLYKNSERVSDCCLTPKEQFFSYIVARTWRCWGPFCTKPTSWTFILLAHWNNSLQVDMSPHSDTLSFQANQSLFFHINAACLAEKQQIPIL